MITMYKRDQQQTSVDHVQKEYILAYIFVPVTP